MKSALPYLLFVCACSLEGLTGGEPGSVSSSSSASSSQGAGGHGGETQSAFTWLASFGNDLVQGTSPYATDAGSGSSLRASAVGDSGDVWVALATKGAIDPDGAGGFDAVGSATSYNLFLSHLDRDGNLLAFRAFEGDFADIDYALQVGAVVRLPGDALAIVGTFKGGSIELGAVGPLAQPTRTDDGFVIRLDQGGEPTHARRLGGTNADVLRGGAVQAQNLVVAGRFKAAFDVADLSGAIDPACSYDESSETYERSVVAVLDGATLSCSAMVTFGASSSDGTQQAHALAIDASGVYVGGTFWRQIVAPATPPVAMSSGEDGFVVALEPDLTTPTVRWVARLTSNRSGAREGVRALALWGGSIWVGGYQERGTSAVMDGEPTLGLVDASPDNDCTLALADGRDAVVGRIDPITGACQGALSLGAAEEDEVRELIGLDDGVLAVGSTTVGIAGLDGSLAEGSRDGFFARFGGTRGVTLETGRMIGGVSWDYLDAARPIDGAIILAGSYDAPFDVLPGQADFFVGAMPMP